jgi:CBS domain containing-hemolysin-like protein
MTPLLLFLIGLAVVYVSTVTTAFSALMRLSLRLMAERGGREDALRRYLEDPLRLFVPARILLALLAVLAASLIARVTGVDLARGLPIFVGSMVLFVMLCEHILPLALVRKRPERVLEVLLPSFEALVRVLRPVTGALIRLGGARRERQSGVIAAGAPEVEETVDNQQPERPPDDHDQLQEGQARELLRSLVEFRETMVREVMTPRPDIVAITAQATLGELQALAREQQYSRIPVYRDTLDNIVGFISIKDLILLSNTDPAQSIMPLVRHAYWVPETKRVPELLKEFQRKRVQAAIVVDEYGGTAGLVTLEDLLEEIVGEIQDEYDLEAEPVLQEEDGSFVFSGRTHIRELAERLNVEVGEGEGYETVGGYLLAHVGRVPAVGETFEIDRLSVEVLEAERRRITRVRVRPLEDVAVGVPEPTE